jgi:DNA-binding NtrC family response regulator
VNVERNTEVQAPRILVVDDEESIRHVLKTFLDQNGCEVTAAASAEEALDVLPDARPDVALVDVVLPGKSGIELLSEIKRRSPDTEVVLMTGHGSAATAVKAIRLGAYDYLEKPLSPLAAVRLIVWRALEKRSLSMQVRQLVMERACKCPGVSQTFEEIMEEDDSETVETVETAAAACDRSSDPARGLKA